MFKNTSVPGAHKEDPGDRMTDLRGFILKRGGAQAFSARMISGSRLSTLSLSSWQVPAL